MINENLKIVNVLAVFKQLILAISVFSVLTNTSTFFVILTIGIAYAINEIIENLKTKRASLRTFYTTVVVTFLILLACWIYNPLTMVFRNASMFFIGYIVGGQALSKSRKEKAEDHLGIKDSEVFFRFVLSLVYLIATIPLIKMFLYDHIYHLDSLLDQTVAIAILVFISLIYSIFAIILEKKCLRKDFTNVLNIFNSFWFPVALFMIAVVYFFFFKIIML